MREEFVRDPEYDGVIENRKEMDIYEEIDISKKKLQSYYENMNYVSGNMIDYYVYQIKAEQAKFGYLLNEIKQSKLEEEQEDNT